MSTKIYRGSRYPLVVGAERYVTMLAPKIRRVQETLVAEAAGRLLHALVWARLSGKEFRRDVTDTFVSDLTDRQRLDLESDGGLPLVTDQLIKRASESAQRLDSAFALEFSLCFVADPAGGQWGYASPFCSNVRLADVWMSMPGVEDYAYWDNTDGPDDLSEQQWDERASAWARVLGWDSWDQRGVTFEPPIPSATFLFTVRRRWFLAAAAAGFAAAERGRLELRERQRSPQGRATLSGLLTRHGVPTTAIDIAARQEAEDTEFAGRFR